MEALPLMVDCRPGAAAPHELAHANNGGENHNQGGGPGAEPTHAASPPARTPAPAAPMPSYAGPLSMPVVPGGVPASGYGYGGCVKSLVWCASPPPPPPPPPPVNPHVVKSVQPNGADLPMNDIPTLRYYFNLGVECMWAAYGAPPPRHYSPRDLAMDMQQISLQDRAPSVQNAPHEHNKHKPDNKPPLHKGNAQRPLLGPRFKRGNQDGAPNNHQNKPHNNNVPNKGPNNRRNSVPEPRPGYEEAGGEPALVPLPYMPYPPPMYPLPYYPVEDPAMLGMMGGMGYVSYEESLPYYPQPYPPPLHPPHLHPHDHHK